jgi:hypothetical protein
MEQGNQIFVKYFRTFFVTEWHDEGDLSHSPTLRNYFYRHVFDHFLASQSPEDALFGMSQLFRLRVLASFLKERGVDEMVWVVRKFLSSNPSSELSLLCQLLELTSVSQYPSFHIDAFRFLVLTHLTPTQYNDPHFRLKQLHQECEEWWSIGAKESWFRQLRNYLASTGYSLKRIIEQREVDD